MKKVMLRAMKLFLLGLLLQGMLLFVRMHVTLSGYQLIPWLICNGSIKTGFFVLFLGCMIRWVFPWAAPFDVWSWCAQDSLARCLTGSFFELAVVFLRWRFKKMINFFFQYFSICQCGVFCYCSNLVIVYFLIPDCWNDSVMLPFYLCFPFDACLLFLLF